MPATLPEHWRSRAAELQPFAPAAAAAFQRCADELEAALRDAGAELLTLGQAAIESGYSTRRLRELVAAGDIPQGGRRGAPRIRRRDLPRRARRPNGAGGYDPDLDAGQLVARRVIPAADAARLVRDGRS